jgi:hypothetical protein
MMELAKLDPDKILETAQRLGQRVDERFPKSGLHRVSQQLVELASRAKATSRWIARPHRLLRALSIGVIGVMILATAAAITVAFMGGTTNDSPQGEAWPEVVQASESALQDLVLLGAAIWFFVSFETRFKRGRVLRAVHELRTLAHLVDVHQLTKNPETIGQESMSTPSSPVRRLTAWQMGRYLDYCSEMLSLVATIAALYSDGFDDADAVDAVTDLEDLCNALQNKIWQKIMLLETRGAMVKRPEDLSG